jgi:hypothetical protein
MRSAGALMVVASLVAGGSAVGGAGCGRAAPGEDLDRLRREAVEANAAALAAHPSREAVAPGRTLTLAGELERAGVVLTWRELDALATTHVRTINPHDLLHPEQVVDYRGVAVRELLERFGAAPAATEVTFVSIDGYRATIDVEDAKRFPIALAVAADDAPIDRWHGGPMYLVFPHSEAPESRRYTGRFWGFYVTDLIVGTEAARLRVDGHALDAAALEALPRSTLDSVVAWKIGWPAGAVHLIGVELTEVLRRAGVTVPPGGQLLVRGKAPLHRDPDSPVLLAGEDLERCEFLLVTRWGSEAERVPARLGGPVALAVPPTCSSRYGERFWIPFVEELVVQRPAAPGAPRREGAP